LTCKIIISLLCSGLLALASDMQTPQLTPQADRLFQAIRNGDTAGVRLALVAGAPIEARDPDGSTPLMYAALYSPGTEITRMLLKRGANVSAANNFGATALIWATDDLGKVRLLVEHGAEVNARSKLGKTALMVAASRDGAGPTVRYLLAHGARVDLKDEANGMPGLPIGAGGATALIQAAKARDGEALALLLDAKADVEAKEKNGGTALLNAIALRNQQNVKTLLDHGADCNTTTSSGMSALILAAMRDDATTTARLLACGAKVDAEDAWGDTALMWAAASERAHTETVKLLLDAHADVNHKNKMGETALAWATRRGDTPIVPLLKSAGAGFVAAASAETTAPTLNNGNLFSRIEQSLPRLQQAGPAVFKQRGCVSCHNNMLPTVAATLARAHGHRIDEKAIEGEHLRLLSVLKPARELLVENGDNIPDLQITGPYALLALDAHGHKPDGLTDAAVNNLANKQNNDGSWTIWAPRPPIEYGDIQATALCLRSIQLYAPPGRRAEYDARIRKAGEWLAAANAENATDENWRALGLFWSNTGATTLNEAVQQIVSHQREDGGWAQLPGLQSDAYATGQTLYALSTAGAAKQYGAAWKRGIDYLLRTQQADGTWHVKSRSFPFQPYFESGFPHGHDQWISIAGSSWATMALTLAEAEAREVTEALLRKR
jgi:ankyrin repeat protein